MENITGKQVMFAILLWVYLENTLEIYISYRQIRVYKTANSVPRELKDFMSAQQYHKARLYSLDKANYSIVHTIVIGMIVLTVELLTGLIAYIWYLGVHLADYFRFDTTNEVAVSCFFFIILCVYSAIVVLPFEFYETFGLEEKHGFNRQTRAFFAYNYTMQFVVSTLASIPIVAFIVYVVLRAGDYFFLWLWIFTISMAIMIMILYPVFIAPMSDAYKPLEEGPLKKSIEQLATSQGFPLDKIYVVEGSKRSGHSNAYFAGIGYSKRIVLYDTLLMNGGKADASKVPEKERGRGCTNEEVLAVLSHELGHWKRGHFIKLVFFNQLYLLFMLFAFQCLFQFGPFYEAFGFEPGVKPIIVGLHVVMTYVLSPLNTLIRFGMNMVSRRMEYDADEFAHSLGYSNALKMALIKMHSENLIFPECDWLYSAWNDSHPTLLERLQRLKELNEG